MAASESEERRDRARRAQQLSDRARELAGGEREAVERCERLAAEASDPALAELHRRAAALHREALEHYQEAALLQRSHADHERLATERADAIEPGRDLGARDAAADRRDATADEREHTADVRDVVADRRDRHADAREQHQDERERLQEERERRFDDATGHRTPRQRDQLARAKTTLRRLEEKLARDDAAHDRGEIGVGRDQATIDRESAATRRRERLPEPAPDQGPGEGPEPETR